MHQEAITSKAKEIFNKLKNFPEFYLADRTWMALQLRYRVRLILIFLGERY